MKFGLENISRLCAALGHPERAFRPVLVAGTNGKGSVSAMVHRALIAAGHHAGRYTSPHLERLEERIVVGDREVGADAFDAAADTVRVAADALLASRTLETRPTFFEAVTATAFEVFRRSGVTVGVLEVGLGGRLDATNVVTPVAAAITSIDFDHQTQLGDTLEAIAYEKAGVIRPGIPVVCGEMPPGPTQVIRDICAARGAHWYRAAECVDLASVTGGRPLALRGAHQAGNAQVTACLLTALDGCGVRVDGGAIRAGLFDVHWPGRLETMSCGEAEVLLDAAHNPAGARALAAYLREAGWGGAALVFGVAADKEFPAMLGALADVCGRIICTRPDTPRAAAPADVSAHARAAGPWQVSVEPDPQQALAQALAESRRVVVAGSIFLIGPLRGILRR